MIFPSLGDTETENTSTQTDIILTSQIVSIARNLDPVVAGRLSYLEHSSSLDEFETSSHMEKFFPNLRRSKSKESLDVSSEGSGKHKRQRSESGLKKSKSRDDLTKNEPETSVLKFSLKKSKSREELTSAESDKKPPKEKGSRGFMKWNKSKEHVEQLDPPPSKEKKGFLKRNKSKDNLANDVEQKPRKSIDSSSDSNKSESKPEIISKLKMKKREKKSEARIKQQSHPKFMSVEETILLKSLDVWYENIDQTLPDEFLTDEDRAIKKLKILYENDTLKEKPVAHKPKEYLAISKPLLDSVVLNPKLERIFKDPKLPTVDSEVRQSALEETRSEVDGPPLTNLPKRTLENVAEYPEQPSYRAVSYNRMSNDILPTDSASNPRYSVKNQELPKPNIYINYENLDEIVHRIPPEAGENKLNEEQKFALKLKRALNEAEKKHTLKKKKKSMRGQEISAPLRESVEKNWKLKEILMNPQIKIAEEPQDKYEWKRHSTDISSHLNTLERPKVVLQQNSKSYEDISFSFIPETKLLKKYDSVDVGKATTDSSSSRSFTSAEFNLDTGDVVLRPNDQKEDLLYNATINKTKSEKRQSKELIEKMINELAKQEEEDDDEIHHPKIIEAREQYKKELQLALRRLDQDELRRSARKQRHKAMEQSDDSLSSREDLTENSATRRSFVGCAVSKTQTVEIGKADEEIPVLRHTNQHPVPKHRTKRPDLALSAECVNYRVVEDAPQFNNQDTGDNEESPEVLYENLRDAYTEDVQLLKDQSLKDLAEQNRTNYNVIQSQDKVEARPKNENLKFEEHEKYGIFQVVQAPSREEFIGFALSKEELLHNLVIEEPQPKEEDLSDQNSNFRLDKESPKLVLPWADHTTPENNSFHSKPIEAYPPKSETAEDLDDQNPDRKFTEDYAKYDLHFAVEAPPKEEFTAYIVPKDVELHSLVVEESQPEVEPSRETTKDLDDQNTDFKFSEDIVKYNHALQAPLKNEFTAVTNNELLHSLVIEEVTEQPRSEISVDGQIPFNPEDSNEYTNQVAAPETEKHHRLSIEETPLIEESRDSNRLIIEELDLENPNSEANSVQDLMIEDATPSSEMFYHQHDRNSLMSEEHSPEYSNMVGNFIPPPVDFLDETQKDPELNKSQYDTLKENQYGVVSPDGVRYTYRNVVKEFKSRYSDDDNDERPEQTEDEDVTFENPDDFVDHFFKPVLQEPPVMSMIDKEMQNVIDKYVHDRDSLLNKGSKTGLKKFDNFENLTKIAEGDVAETWQSAKVVTTVIEEQTATLSQDEETEPLSLEDLHFIEEMKLKYSGVDTASNSSEEDDKSRRLSEINEQDLSVIIEQTEEEPPKAKPKCRIPRPLSGINEQDLLLIEKVTKSLQTIEEPPKISSRIPIKKQTSEEYLPPSLRPKRPSNLPLNRPKSYATTTSSLPQFNKRYSYQGVQERTPVEDQRSSGRMSDLIFKETIFIPHENHSKQSSANKEPKSPDTETIFIAKTTQESPLTPEQTSSKSTVKINWNRYPTSPSNTWSNSLKKGLLDTPVIAYEPVYSRTSREDVQTKPLPAPRVNTYQTSKTSVLTVEMTDTNFSDEKNLHDVKVENLEPAGNQAQSQEVILVEQSKAHTNILENLKEPAGLEHVVETKVSNPSGAQAPPEVLDSDVEEVPRQSSSNLDTSNVNLFHMDTPPAYDSYMELFRSRESKEFDTLTKKSIKPHMGGFVYVEEIILEDSGASSMDDSPSMPKIVDFVPLDDQTTSVFTKPETDRTYDTLEREKTFHVLGQAASIATIKENKEPESLLELLTKKSSNLSKSSSSRTSFSQAKKLFEALAEANNKEEKPRLSGSKPTKVNKTRDSKSMEQVPDGAVSKE